MELILYRYKQPQDIPPRTGKSPVQSYYRHDTYQLSHKDIYIYIYIYTRPKQYTRLVYRSKTQDTNTYEDREDPRTLNVYRKSPKMKSNN